MHTQRVHIVPVSHEFDRVLRPLLEYRADVVYLLYDERPADRPAYYDDLESELEDSGLERGETLRCRQCDHGDPYAIFGLVTTIASRYADDDVAVNVGTGGELAAIGAALGCMDDSTDARAYYPEPEEYAYDGQSEPKARGYTGETHLLDYPIQSPEPQQVAMLAVIATEQHGTAAVKKRTLIDRGIALHLATELDIPFVETIIEGTKISTSERDGGFDDLTPNEQKSAYQTLKSHILDPLEERDYIEIDDAGRSDPIELTGTGEKALQAFRHKITDVIEELERLYPRPGSPGAEVPDTLTEGLEDRL